MSRSAWSLWASQRSSRVTREWPMRAAMSGRCGLSLMIALGALAWCAAKEPPSTPVSDRTTTAATDTPKAKDETPKELFSGKVVMLPDALKRRGIKSLEEFKGQVVLEPDDNERIPVVRDWRGRALFK